VLNTNADGVECEYPPPIRTPPTFSQNYRVEASISIPDVSYAGVAGCCNSNTSHAGVQVTPTDETAEAVSSGIPYIQVLTCQSVAPTFDSIVPRSALMYTSVSCPPGWDIALTLSGRYLVALPEGGRAGAIFGGQSLPPSADVVITHDHSFSNSISTTPAGVGLASGCCSGGYARNGQYNVQGIGYEEPVDFPYATATLCRQL
jgi:hypothetical protein